MCVFGHEVSIILIEKNNINKHLFKFFMVTYYVHINFFKAFASIKLHIFSEKNENQSPLTY